MNDFLRHPAWPSHTIKLNFCLCTKNFLVRRRPWRLFRDIGVLPGNPTVHDGAFRLRRCLQFLHRDSNFPDRPRNNHWHFHQTPRGRNGEIFRHEEQMLHLRATSLRIRQTPRPPFKIPISHLGTPSLPKKKIESSQPMELRLLHGLPVWQTPHRVHRQRAIHPRKHWPQRNPMASPRQVSFFNFLPS